MSPISIFHGSDTVVEQPRVIRGNHRLDFGFGFYTTFNELQAKDFARKVFIRKGRVGVPTVSRYKFDIDVLVNPQGLKILKFETPGEDNQIVFRTPSALNLIRYTDSNETTL